MTSPSPAQQLRQLATVATLGSDRAAADARSPDKLLARAALVGARARAGYRPRSVIGRISECPDDPRPVAASAPMTTLLRLLGAPDAGLIEEWAELAHARGLRVADHVVPTLLDWWCRQPQRKAVVFNICGKRGDWLASLNPAWRKPVASDDIPPNADDLWQTGTSPERLAILITIRTKDPARARSLVQSTWASDSADERRRFVEALAVNCSMEDEPFLETALDDKSKVVKRAAFTVLRGLPGSRLRSRMNELARAIIVVEGKKGLLKKSPRVVLRPPQDFDKMWERDGLEEQAASGMGKRAWWMRQILSSTDLRVWTEVTGLEPAAIIEAISEDAFFGVAADAITDALELTEDSVWAAAMLRHRLSDKKSELADFARLTAKLKHDDRLQLLIEAAEHKRFSIADRWELLSFVDQPWPRDFSERALGVLEGSFNRKSEVWRLYDLVARVARRVSPDLAERFAEVVASMFPDEPTDSFKRSIDCVRLRADMHKEFES